MSGGKKKQGQMGQKHQNKTAFKIQFNPLALEIHKKVSFRGLCKRCAGQIAWKLQYNKYKRMTEASRCALCEKKAVLRTYMSACEPCSESLRVCPKCLDPESEEQVEVKLTEKEQRRKDEENERKMNEFLKTLKERSRRTVKRLLEKGTISWDEELNNYVDEEGNTLPLQFRQGFGGNNSVGDEDEEDIDEFGDEDEEEGDEEQGEKQGKEEETGKEAQKKASKPSNDKGGKGKKEKVAEQDQNEEQQGEDSEQGGSEGEEEEEEEEEDINDAEQEDHEAAAPQQQSDQNQEDWEDIEDENQEEHDEDENEDEDEEEQEQDSEEQKHKKKRKLSSHKRGRHHK